MVNSITPSLVLGILILVALSQLTFGDNIQPLTGPTTPPQWGVVSEGLQMSARIDTNDFADLSKGGTADSIVVGHFAVLQAVVRNTTKVEGGWGSLGSPENEFTIIVKDSKGHVVADSTPGPASASNGTFADGIKHAAFSCHGGYFFTAPAPATDMTSYRITPDQIAQWLLYQY